MCEADGLRSDRTALGARPEGAQGARNEDSEQHIPDNTDASALWEESSDRRFDVDISILDRCATTGWSNVDERERRCYEVSQPLIWRTRGWQRRRFQLNAVVT